MKKLLSLATILLISIALISWGYVGHKTIATIAENHLTPEAKAGIKELLGDQSIADIASWADEVRDKPEYKSTFQLHFINAPLGLSYEQFSDSIKAQGEHNVYSAILKYEGVIKSSVTTKEEKAEALKFIVHFVGDAHQPMHVSRKEDKGGNTIQVQFNGKGTNLHSLWDSGLINKQGLPFDQMAKEYDNATPNEIKRWQSDPMIKWMWESYQLSTNLYAEIEKNNVLDDDYYKQHIPIVQQRIEMAGIRLAGLLNEIFTAKEVESIKHLVPPPVVLSGSDNSFTPVKIDDVQKHIGEQVNVSTTIASYKEFNNLLLINLAKPYPNSLLTLVFRGDAIAIGDKLKNETGMKIIVLGKLINYNGKAEIAVTQANQILQQP